MSVLLAQAAASACADHLPPVVWEGEHVTFASDANVGEICGGTLSRLDSITGHLGGVFGLSGTPRIDYYWAPEGVGAYCEGDPWGCTRHTTVFSEHVLHQHELVHAVRDTDRSSYDPFEEGLAEAFGDDWDPPTVFGGDVRTMWKTDWNGHLPDAYYPLAGYFVSYLVAEYGIDATMVFDRASSYRDSSRETNDRFESSFGESIDQAIAGVDEEYPRCEQTRYRDNSFECMQPAITAVGDLELSVAMGCEQGDVLGPRRGERWKTVVIEIPETGVYDYGFAKIGGTEPGRLKVRRCGQSCFDVEGAQWDGFSLFDDEAAPDDEQLGDISLSACFAAGRYVARFAVDEDDAGDFLLRLDFGHPGC
jgi:hypothetical protein